MNVRYKKSTATPSIHPKSSFYIISSSSVRRTSDNKSKSSHYQLAILLIIILYYHLFSSVSGHLFDAVPPNHNSQSSLLSQSLSSYLLNTDRASNHDISNDFNEDHKNIELSTTSSSSPSRQTSSSKYLDNLLLKFNISNISSSIEPTDVSNLVDYLLIDKSYLLKNSESIFLNLTRFKLKRDQRNLERRNDTAINLIKLIDFAKLNDSKLMSTSNLSNDNLSAEWINNSDIIDYGSWQQQLIADQVNNLENSINVEDTTSIQAKDSLTMVMSILYIIIFFTGVFGNMGTCIVILKNKYMRTATNYYLFSLSVSDLTLLLVGLPQDLFLLWRPYNYPFGQEFCILRGFTSEASSNASVLTITAFTIERYLAICQPLRAHTMSKLNRVVKLVCLIWLVSALFALPLALQFGINHEPMQLNEKEPKFQAALCTIKTPITYSFEISTLFFFIIPLILLTVLYIKIGIHLRRSEKCITRQHVNTQHSQSNLSPNESLLLANINAPSSPNSNANHPIVIDGDHHFDTNSHQQEDRRNSKDSIIFSTNFIRKIVRSCSNSSIMSSLSLKLNLQSSQHNSSQIGSQYQIDSQMNLHQINSHPNITTTQPSSNNNSIAALYDCGSSRLKTIDMNAIDDQSHSVANNNIDFLKLERKGSVEEASHRNKSVGRLRNVIEEKDGEELSEENAVRICMLIGRDEDANLNSIDGRTKVGQQLPNDVNLNGKRKKFQKMTPFSTVDSSSSNGWSKGAVIANRTNTALHSQDSSASLNVRRKNWRFFKNRHSTRTIHHSSSSRRAVVKMLVAVVVAFFGCWAPFHIQRIFATLIKEPTEPQIILHNILTNISGVTYYLSATINPILYSIMSLKFRQAFKDTLHQIWCLKSSSQRRRRVISALANIHHEDSTSRCVDTGAAILNKTFEQQNNNRVPSIEFEGTNRKG